MSTQDKNQKKDTPKKDDHKNAPKKAPSASKTPAPKKK